MNKLNQSGVERLVSIQNSRWSRMDRSLLGQRLATALFVLVALFLAACGGGGGFTPGVAATTGTIQEFEGCTVPAGAAVCEGRAVISLGGGNAVLEVGENGVIAAVPVTRSGEVRFTLTGAPDDYTIRLRSSNGQILDGGNNQKIVAKTCAGGSAWDTALQLPGKEDGQCTQKLCYTNRALMLRDFGAPHAITPTSVVFAENQTGLDKPQGWGARFFSFAIKYGLDPDPFGRIVMAAVDAKDLVIRPIYYNPITNTYHRYGLGVVAVADFNEYDYYSLTEHQPGPNAPFLGWLRSTELPEGWFFTVDGPSLWWQAKGHPLPAAVRVSGPSDPFNPTDPNPPNPHNVRLIKTFSHICN